jgi:hypothetical protein
VPRIVFFDAAVAAMRSEPKAGTMQQQPIHGDRNAPGDRSPRRERQHLRAARAKGLRSASIVTRVCVAASIALGGAFTALAAIAFPGRAARGGAQEARANTSESGHPVVALPPTNAGAGGVPAPPLQAPVAAPGSGQVGSGGS